MGHQQESSTGELPHGSEAVGQKLLAGARHCAESSVLCSAGGCRDTASAFRGSVVPSGRERIQSKSSTKQCCGNFMGIKFCSSKGIVMKVRRPAIDWEDISATHT